MRRRPPIIKRPGDGVSRFNDTELTQAFEPMDTAVRASRRQIVSRAAGDNAGECCATTVDGQGGVTGDTTQQGQINTLQGRIASLGNGQAKYQIATDETIMKMQITMNDLITLISDLYTQGGWTPPIDIPTVEPVSGTS